MSKKKAEIVELDERDVTATVNRLLVAIVPMKIDSFHLCAALQVILGDLADQGYSFELVDNETASTLN